MNWVIRNKETGQISAGFRWLAEAQNWARDMNRDYQTDAFQVKAFDLYYNGKK